MTIYISMLTDYMSGGEVMKQKLVEVGFGRVLPWPDLSKSIPDFASRYAIIIVYLGYNKEMKFRVAMQPVKKKSNDVVRRDPCGSSI